MPLAIPIVVLLAAVFMLALVSAQSSAMRPYWEAFIKGLSALPLFGVIGAFAGRFIARIVREAASAITHAAGASLGVLADWINAYAGLKLAQARSVYEFATDVVRTLEYWSTHAIGAAISAGTAAPRALAEAAQRRADRAWTRARHAERVAAKASGAAAAIPQLRHRVGAIARTLDRLRDLARGIDRRARSLARRLTRVEKLTAAAALAAGVVRVLARRFPWIFCRRVDRVARQVCGIDATLLEALLGSTLFVASALSLQQMARELREPTALVMDGLEEFVRELDRLR